MKAKLTSHAGEAAMAAIAKVAAARGTDIDAEIQEAAQAASAELPGATGDALVARAWARLCQRVGAIGQPASARRKDEAAKAAEEAAAKAAKSAARAKPAQAEKPAEKPQE